MGEKRAIVLLSGGLDSATVLAIAKDEGYKIFVLTFDYGQRHDKELIFAKKIAEYFQVEEHLILKIELDKIDGSSLTDKNIEIEKRPINKIKDNIPSTYVPGRNTIFLSFALSWAEVLRVDAIFIGANAVDFSGYPDCRAEFFKAFRKISELGTKIGIEGNPIKISTPIIGMKKAEIIKKGKSLCVPFELTWSCYQGMEKACGKCDSCLLRLKGFQNAGIKDPIEYF